MRANKLLLLFLLTLPLTVFSQMGNTQYKEVISFALDSIIQNDTTNFFISPLIKRETEFLDFHGNSENCKIQHQLLLEILLNGQQSRLDELEIKQLTPESLRNESAKYRIELSTIIRIKIFGQLSLRSRIQTKLEVGLNILYYS